MSDLKKTILEMTRGDLEDIEAAIRENLTPNLEIVSEIAGHILFAGGKRLRPLLMTLSAKMCGARRYDPSFSTIFEYLHTATLLHDDLVDEAELRRGKPATHSIWGPAAAVLAGDFLLARSLSIAAKTKKSKVIAAIAQVTEEMAQGEIQQLTRKKALDLSEAEYMEIIERKTAAAFQGACLVSAVIAEASAEKKKALADFGRHLGIAFQMADDLLDYDQDAENLGKNPGADLREGKLTLPVIHALESASGEERAFMEDIIRKDAFSSEEFSALIRLLKRLNGISYTRDMAGAYAEKAKAALAVFGPSEPKKILFMIADYAIERNM
ncbi:Polyprenyl synthetase [Candidatus Desulfarcum epimagneticum]|uniref:Polyprenyl synthetase n=1 Tax=uncultured Desulfobacteraceae bacterium TaxID=218296 RepID=A0A484HKZ5_9BACT|nr:Polyprenyl synthetase [uncultured Desulfobacteraceae bacterium]